MLDGFPKMHGNAVCTDDDHILLFRLVFRPVPLELEQDVALDDDKESHGEKRQSFDDTGVGSFRPGDFGQRDAEKKSKPGRADDPRDFLREVPKLGARIKSERTEDHEKHAGPDGGADVVHVHRRQALVEHRNPP